MLLLFSQFIVSTRNSQVNNTHTKHILYIAKYDHIADKLSVLIFCIFWYLMILEQGNT